MAAAELKKVLVVDDDDALREVLQHVLKQAGMDVDGASDGHDAQSKILIRPPDLIILDLMMPGVSGLELIRALMSDGLGYIPVIVVTGRHSMDAAYDQMVRQESNVKEFLRKPLDYVKLVQRIHELLKI